MVIAIRLKILGKITKIPKHDTHSQVELNPGILNAKSFRFHRFSLDARYIKG